MDKLDINLIRKDFDILNKKIYDKNLVYFDNAATTHKPNYVLDSIKNYNITSNANPHRGAHSLSISATNSYENSRDVIRNFINAKYNEEIIFTRNTTESLNLIAYSYGMNFINKDDEIVLCISNHHSNILPWQHVANIKEAKIKYIYLDENGNIALEDVKNVITENTKIVSISHMSNALGNIYPIKEIIDIAHEKGSIIIIDGAQSVPHIKIDVKELNADFFCFSGHKLYGPMGIGVLYGKKEILNEMPPFLSGGDMIEYVEEQSSTFAPLPYKFEAGTQNVEGAVGLSAAIDYISNIGLENIYKHEMELTKYALNKLNELPFIELYGCKDVINRGGVISFNVKDVHSHDVASILDSYGIAIRSGHHCAQPLMKYLNINSTCRVSFSVYNTKEEIDVFINSIKNVRKWLGYGS